MKKLHYIPNCWHEQIAKLYDLELVTENADIVILRDPFDRAVEEVMDFLDSGGNTRGKTFEELVFENSNVYCKSLKIDKVHTDDLKEKNYKFVWFTSYAVWPRISGVLRPKEQVKNHKNFTLQTTAEQLSKYLGVESKPINVNQRFDTFELDTALRGDFQVSNTEDYSLLRKLKTRADTGDRYEVE